MKINEFTKSLQMHFENSRVSEGNDSKPLTSDQQRLKTLSDQKATATKKVKAERARQMTAKAQQAVRQVNATQSSVCR